MSDHFNMKAAFESGNPTGLVFRCVSGPVRKADPENPGDAGEPGNSQIAARLHPYFVGVDTKLIDVDRVKPHWDHPQRWANRKRRSA